MLPSVQPLEAVEDRPERSTIILRRDGSPYVVRGGDATTDYTCGACARVVAKAPSMSALGGLVLVCGACGAMNVTRP